MMCKTEKILRVKETLEIIKTKKKIIKTNAV